MFHKIFPGLIALGILLGTNNPAAADPSEKLPLYTNNPVVAVVDGEPLTMDDLKDAQIHDAMDHLHKMQESALKKKILEVLSKKHPQLNRHQIREVTPRDIAHFYNTTPGVKDLGSMTQMSEEIRQYLEAVFRENYIEKNYQLALKKGWAQVYLKPPNEFRLVADIGSAVRWFNKDANTPRKLFLLEYSDFQCPFCKRVQATLVKVRQHFSSQVQFGYRHFPLPFHKEAKGLAEAVECARDQGRFWQLHALFYAANGSTVISRDAVLQLAKRAGVGNLRAFQECWDGGKHRERVLKDIQEGISMGIQGTPAFIVGIHDPETGTVSGEMLSGAVSEEKFGLAIEKYLSISRAQAKLVQ